MFSQLSLSTDTEVMPSEVTHLVLAEAIAQISKLTGLSKQASKALVKQQLFNTSDKKTAKCANDEIITHHETDFIFDLFNNS